MTRLQTSGSSLLLAAALSAMLGACGDDASTGGGTGGTAGAAGSGMGGASGTGASAGTGATAGSAATAGTGGVGGTSGTSGTGGVGTGGTGGAGTGGVGTGGTGGTSAAVEAPVVTAVVQMMGTLHVSWTLPAAGCDSIELWRSHDGGALTKAYTLTGEAETQHDMSASPPGSYCYRARCVLGGQASADSNEMCGTP